YQLTATATDNANNPTSTSLTFVYDTQKTSSSVTSPAGGSYVTSLTSLSGKANDQIGSPTNPSGIAAGGVSVAIEQLTGNGSWWNGTNNFALANPVYSTATFVGASSGTWTYSVPLALQNALINGASYYIVSRSTDIAGNTEFGMTGA